MEILVLSPTADLLSTRIMTSHCSAPRIVVDTPQPLSAQAGTMPFDKFRVTMHPLTLMRRGVVTDSRKWRPPQNLS